MRNAYVMICAGMQEDFSGTSATEANSCQIISKSLRREHKRDLKERGALSGVAAPEAVHHLFGDVCC